MGNHSIADSATSAALESEQINSMSDSNTLPAAWPFLTLDLVMRFQRDLWLPDEFVACSRVLRQSWGSVVVNSAADLEYRHYASMDAIQAECGPEVLEWILLWLQHIDIREGPDRKGEFFWSALLRRLSRRKNITLPAWLEPKVTLAASALSSRAEAIKRQIDAARISEISAWDSDLIASSEGSLEFTLDHLGVILSHNSLVSIWEQHLANLSLEQLAELYEIGQAIGPEMVSAGLRFPGCWRLEYSPFLRKLPIA